MSEVNGKTAVAEVEIASSILASEQAFFDEEAADLDDEQLRIPADQIERYRTARRGPLNIPTDAFFADVGPLHDQHVLDYGCGTGETACLLAACGARVTAFDLSPGSIQKARRRAELHGVADRIQFDVRAAGQTGYSTASFDVVLGYAILHHLHMALDRVYAEVARILVPGGTAYFIEPVANSRALRFLRRLVPIPTYATPDERQLTYHDFDLLYRDFTRVEIEHFYCLERLHRLFGSRLRTTLRRIDAGLQQRLPFVMKYYGAVMVKAQR